MDHWSLGLPASQHQKRSNNWIVWVILSMSLHSTVDWMVERWRCHVLYARWWRYDMRWHKMYMMDSPSLANLSNKYNYQPHRDRKLLRQSPTAIDPNWNTCLGNFLPHSFYCSHFLSYLLKISFMVLCATYISKKLLRITTSYYVLYMHMFA